MAKRRLSQQQQQRIAKNQQTRARNTKATNEQSLGAEQPGLVMARYSKHVDICPIDQGNVTIGKHYRCHIRANIDSIAVGDKVIWRHGEQGNGVVEAVQLRNSLIERPDGLGKLKPVAANIDQLFIVIAAKPEAHPNLLDRYLIAAENANIKASILFNKLDLLNTLGQKVDDTSYLLLDTYRQLGYPVYEISCLQQQGLTTVREQLMGNTSVFVGQSGVGKSSLINALIPHLAVKTGELSEHVSKGKHTTTTANLYPLAENSFLIDSPGIREFHLNHFSEVQIYQGYRELCDSLGHCKFRDCQHKEEPGCAIKPLLNTDNMAATRINSLEYILNSLTF